MEINQNYQKTIVKALTNWELWIIKTAKNWDRITCQKSTPTSTSYNAMALHCKNYFMTKLIDIWNFNQSIFFFIPGFDWINNRQNKIKMINRCDQKWHHVLSLVIVSSYWSSCPLIAMVTMFFHCSSCLLMGNHVLHVNPILMLQAEIPSLSRKCCWESNDNE